jgi:phosphocarrier protein HPr
MSEAHGDFRSNKLGGKPSMPGLRRRQAQITNELGLHLRVASRLVQLAQQFQSEVRVLWNGREANAKSILDLMTLGAEFGALIELEASGSDSEEAVAALSELVESHIHEHSDGRDHDPES